MQFCGNLGASLSAKQTIPICIYGWLSLIRCLSSIVAARTTRHALEQSLFSPTRRFTQTFTISLCWALRTRLPIRYKFDTRVDSRAPEWLTKLCNSIEKHAMGKLADRIARRADIEITLSAAEKETDTHTHTRAANKSKREHERELEQTINSSISNRCLAVCTLCTLCVRFMHTYIRMNYLFEIQQRPTTTPTIGDDNSVYTTELKFVLLAHFDCV